MSNPDSYAVVLGKPEGRGQTDLGRIMRTLGAAVVSVLIVAFCFKRGGWNAGWAAMFILLAVVLSTVPAKFRRLGAAFYLASIVAWWAGSHIQNYLASSRVQALAASSSVVRLLAGDYTEQVILSLVLGSLAGLLAVGLPLVGLMLVSSEFVLGLGEGLGISRRMALRCLWALLMGTQLPWAIVENGKVTQTKPPGVLPILGGPGLVVIRPDNAVVFELGGKVTRIEGPGVVCTKPFEGIKRIVRLGPQRVTCKAEDVLTKDRIPLSFEVTVSYQIEPKKASDSRLETATAPKHFEGQVGEAHPVYREAVFRAVYNTDAPSEQELVRREIVTLLRRVVFEYNLDQLFDYSVVRVQAATVRDSRPPTPVPGQLVVTALKQAVEQELTELAPSWGIQITGLDVATVGMPPEILEKVIKWWEAVWEQRTLIAKAEGERDALVEKGRGQAQALAAIEGERTRARGDLLRQLHTFLSRVQGGPLSPDLATEVLIIFERVSARLCTDSATRLKYLEALEAMLGSEGEKTFVLGKTPLILPDEDH